MRSSTPTSNSKLFQDSMDMKMEFCMRIARNVILKEINNGNNMVLSPLSLHTMLNMLASGSTGPTLEQLLGFLESQSITHLNTQSSEIIALATMGERPTTMSSLVFYDSDEDIDDENGGFSASSKQGPTLGFVNGIWVDHKFPLKASFKEIVKDVYKAKASTVDFLTQGEKVRNEVNLWAEKATNGLIKNLIPPGSPDPSTILILANALYFKGTWHRDYAFDASNTCDKDFHLINGPTRKVPFMTSNSDCFYYASFDGFRVLQLPYKKGQDCKRFSMNIFLPDKKNGLQELIEKFNSHPKLLLHYHSKLKYQDVSKMWIPKFKISFNFEASEVMKELGLNLPFEETGDFKEMVDSLEIDKVYVSGIIHKSCIEVTEEGTEAAACFVTDMMGCSLYDISPPPISFIADHPFMFTIEEKFTRAVFFIGAVLEHLVEA